MPTTYPCSKISATPGPGSLHPTSLTTAPIHIIEPTLDHWSQNSQAPKQLLPVTTAPHRCICKLVNRMTKSTTICNHSHWLCAGYLNPLFSLPRLCFHLCLLVGRPEKKIFNFGADQFQRTRSWITFPTIAMQGYLSIPQEMYGLWCKITEIFIDIIDIYYSILCRSIALNWKTYRIAYSWCGYAFHVLSASFWQEDKSQSCFNCTGTCSYLCLAQSAL